MCFSSCGSQQDVQNGPCTIEGITSGVKYDKIYLRDHSMGIIDSTSVTDGKFAFHLSDSLTMPFIANVHFYHSESPAASVFMTVAVEPGLVRLGLNEMIELSGTPLNDRIKKFYDQMQQVYDAIMNQTMTLDQSKEMYSKFYLKQIISNRKNVLGQYLLDNYAHALLPEDLAKAEKKLQ